MGKLKYAFIMESGTLTPETHTVIHENRDNYDIVAAVNSLKMAEELAKKLAGEGFSNIDLCGAFDAEKAAKVAAATDGKIDVRYTKYSPEDSKRMDTMKSLKEYGIILMENPIPKTDWLYMYSDEFNTTIALVNSLESACEAAKKMVDDGIIFKDSQKCH